jgi:hypothetical protein
MKTKTLTLTGPRHVFNSDRPCYRIEKVTNTTEFGDIFLTDELVTDLCAKKDWQVIILPVKT